MNYKELANRFIKQHEGIGYQSNPQMVAIRAFAEWLEQHEAAQHGVQSDGAIPTTASGQGASSITYTIGGSRKSPRR